MVGAAARCHAAGQSLPARQRRAPAEPRATLRALLLDSSFDSALALAREACPWLPVGLLLRDRFRADLAAPHVQVPVLQIHCSEDPVTPLAAAQALHARFARAQPIHLLEGACPVPPIVRYNASRAEFVRSVFAAR